MVNFRNNSTPRKRPPNYLARREQRRLLILVMTLGAVVALMAKAAQPSTWAWLWGKQAAQTQSTTVDAETPAYYDTRIRPTSPERLPLDTFISPAKKPAAPTPQGDYFAGLRPELFAEIRDHAVFRGVENESWYNFLTVLRDAEQAELEQSSIGRVGFGQLFEQPSVYRGKVITVTGVARRAFDLQAPPNDHGIESYYQLWLQPMGGPTSPIVIYTLELPDGFPSSRVAGSDEARNIYEPIEVTGFFFKNWAYSTGSAILSAPLVLSKNVKWTPQVAAADAANSSAIPLGPVIGIAAAIGLLAVGAIYFSSRYRPTAQVGALAARFQAQTESLRKLEEEDLGPDVAETLRALAADEHAADADSGSDDLPRPPHTPT